MNRSLHQELPVVEPLQTSVYCGLLSVLGLLEGTNTNNCAE